MFSRALKPLMRARAIGARVVNANAAGLAANTPAACAAASPWAAMRWSSSSSAQSFPFEAETSQLLDVVVNSLYTDREVFLRELVSNASDALEKARHLQATGTGVVDPNAELAIQIFADESEGTVTILDSGVGMTRDDLIENLGTIARSGSKAFLQHAADKGDTSSVGSSIIGQFGVGFYSAFMVARKVEVHSRSATSNDADPAFVWRSRGTGEYEIAESGDADFGPKSRGNKVVLHLKEDCKSFANKDEILRIINEYSSFVGFPIYFENEKVNTVRALWAMSKGDITEDMYTEFYKYIANAFDEPLFTLHFQTDAPIELKSLFFVGTTNMEKMGMQRLDVGINLYSRKVLVEPKSPGILPDWARFVHGVVDSEDLPLNISRESMQDSALLRRISSVLTKKFLRCVASHSLNALYNVCRAVFLTRHPPPPPPPPPPAPPTHPLTHKVFARTSPRK